MTSVFISSHLKGFYQMAFQKLWTNTVWWQNFLYKRSGTDSHYFLSPHSKFINLKWNIIFFFFFGLSVTGCKEQSPPKLTRDLLRHWSTTAGGKGKSIRQGSEAKRGRESRMRVEGAPSSSVSSVHRLSCLPGRPNTIFLSLSWEQTLQRELEGLSTFLRLLPRRPNTTAHVSPSPPAHCWHKQDSEVTEFSERMFPWRTCIEMRWGSR